MSYNTIAQMSNDGDLLQRFTACAASEGIQNPDGWVQQHKWELVSDEPAVAAYEYAVGTNVYPPGKLENVVNDGMILAIVQAVVAGA